MIQKEKQMQYGQTKQFIKDQLNLGQKYIQNIMKENMLLLKDLLEL